MWKKLSKRLAVAVVDSFAASFLEEAGRELAKRLFSEKKKPDSSPEVTEEEDEAI